MNLQFLYCINVLLAARLILTFNDQCIKLKQTIIITAIQIFSLTLFVNFWVIFILALFIISINFGFFLIEKKIAAYINEIRLVTFIIQVFILGIFCAAPLGLKFNTDLVNLFLNLGEYSVLFSFTKTTDWFNALVVLMGVLLSFNESNLFIRSLFHLFRVFPGPSTEPVLPKIDKREYNAGRIIGILERIIIFFAVFFNQIAVIGFLMAAKGFTRFKELDQRDFAEYILIGTLLSTLVGISVGILVKSLLI